MQLIGDINQENNMATPSTKKRGGDSDVGRAAESKKGHDKAERSLDQGLEESIAGSDPVSVTQPAPSKADKKI